MSISGVSPRSQPTELLKTQFWSLSEAMQRSRSGALVFRVRRESVGWDPWVEKPETWDRERTKSAASAGCVIHLSSDPDPPRHQVTLLDNS